MTERLAAQIVVILSLIGLADAGYLAAKHYTGGPIVCSLLDGCEQVLSSPYAVAAGLPVALWGVFYYLGLLILATAFLMAGGRRLLGFAFGLATGALLASAALVYIQAAILDAWCAYCLLSAVLTTSIFLTLLLARPTPLESS